MRRHWSPIALSATYSLWAPIPHLRALAMRHCGPCSRRKWLQMPGSVLSPSRVRTMFKKLSLGSGRKFSPPGVPISPWRRRLIARLRMSRRVSTLFRVDGYDHFMTRKR